MKILAIDTSANVCAAAIFDSGSDKLLGEISDDIGRGHAEILMGHIESCLKMAGLSYSDLDRLAVACGPGSFTGVRVGMAAAKGLALGLSLPLRGISTLDASEHQAREAGYDHALAVLLDAKRDQAYYKSADGLISVSTYGDLAVELENFEGALCGSGAPELLSRCGASHRVVHADGTAPISTYAQLAAITPDTDVPVQPLYLRSADAKTQTGFALPRAGN